MKELEKTAAYESCNKNSQAVKWFWEILNEFDDHHKRMFLKFVLKEYF